MTEKVGIDLDEIRKHLDRLDTALVNVLAERMSFIPFVSEFKKKNNIERYQPEREVEIIKAKRAIAEGAGVNPDLVEDLFKRIIEDAHRIEKEIIGE